MSVNQALMHTVNRHNVLLLNFGYVYGQLPIPEACFVTQVIVC